MPNPLLDLLMGLSAAANVPGAYFRGVLAGRPGQAASGREMLEAWGALGPNTPGLDWGDVAGGVADVTVDPFNVILPMAGRHLTGAAKAIGPQYAGWGEKLALEQFPGDALFRNEIARKLDRHTMRALSDNPRVARRMLDDPAGRIMQEIPPGSVPLRRGADAIAYLTPDRDVLRIGESVTDIAPEVRAPIPEVLQPTYARTYGPFRVERMPFQENIVEDVAPHLMPPDPNVTWHVPGTPHPIDATITQRQFNEDVSRFLAQVQQRNPRFEVKDYHPGNLAYDAGGKLIAIDPGVVFPPAEMQEALKAQEAAQFATPVLPWDPMLTRTLGYRDWLRRAQANPNVRPPNPLVAMLAQQAAAMPARYGD